LVSHLTIFPQHFWRPQWGIKHSGPLSHQPVAGLHWSREELGTKQGGMPPDVIPGPPSPWSCNPLSSLAPAGLQGEVDQLTWQFHPDSVSPQGNSGPVPLGRKEVWSTPRNLQEEFCRSGTSPKRRKESCNNFWCECVCEWAAWFVLTSAQVCGSTAERLWSQSGSVLWFCGDPHAA
jgi:hypothetical protein